MKHLIAILTALLALVALAGVLTLSAPHHPAQAQELTPRTTTSFWVLSDTHFIAPSLHDGKQAFKGIEQSTAGKDLDYQPVALRAFVHDALAAKPAAVIITGDVTFNGALASAQSIAKRLAPLQAAGIRLLVIPGNHDIYDGWARAYKGPDQLKVAQIAPSDWRRLFNDGYAHALSEDSDSLSYTVALNGDYQLIMLDSNIYPIQPGATNPNTGGELSETTLAWVQRQLAAGQKAGRTSLVFMHHNLYAHNRVVHNGYVLNNADVLKPLLDRYHVPVLFSGHIHAQDIANDPDGQCETTEIVSGSFAVSPGSYGRVTVTPDKLTYTMAESDLTPVLTAKERQNPDLVHYQRYLKSLFIGNGERLAVENLYDRPGVSDKELKAGAEFVGELNWRFFAGADSPTATELAKMRASLGYRVVWQVPALRRYVRSTIQDHNLNDRHFTRTIHHD
ncbi:metallophosphoesterase [Lacticaseibacillus absianus]|uniref:metallophosphoesterase n=1 Tax=Lacticaseibacillus absianus TaxID=2729623 RepID=UPI0015CB68C7|nr:metallophosphoesterase [Lacticaseibacillus absianus]